MSQYRVKTIAHQLKNQVIAKYDDIVDEEQLMGNAQELSNLGFVELIDDASDNSETTIDDMTKNELIVYASDNDIFIEEKANKGVILEQIKAHIESLKTE